jgi:hypothetical protein
MNTHDFTAALNRPNSAFANQVLIVLQRHFNHTVQRVDGSIAAGQAVASAVYQLLGLGEAPFRDLDIFWTETENTPTDKTRPDYQKIEFKDGDQGGVFYVKPEKHKPVNHELKTELTYSPSLAYYGLGAMTVGSYVIKDTFMDAANQRINHILTSLTPHSGLETKIDNARATIQNFDINCCQVALELDTMTLVASEAFVDFLTTKALKVVNYNTTMHSAIRLEKKNNDIAFASVDMDSELATLQTLRQFVVEVEQRRKDMGYRYWPLYGNAFSDVYLERFQDASETIQSAFSLYSKTFTFSERFEKDSANVDDRHKALIRKEKSTLFFLAPTNYDKAFIDAAKTLIPILPMMNDANPLMLFVPAINTIKAHPELKATLEWFGKCYRRHSRLIHAARDVVAITLRDDYDAPIESIISSIKNMTDFLMDNTTKSLAQDDLILHLLHYVKSFNDIDNIPALYHEINNTRDIDNFNSFYYAISKVGYGMTYEELDLVRKRRERASIDAFHAKFPQYPNHIPYTLSLLLNHSFGGFSDDDDAPTVARITPVSTSHELCQLAPDIADSHHRLWENVLSCIDVTFSDGATLGVIVTLYDKDTAKGKHSDVALSTFKRQDKEHPAFCQHFLMVLRDAILHSIHQTRISLDPLVDGDDFADYPNPLLPVNDRGFIQ